MTPPIGAARAGVFSGGGVAIPDSAIDLFDRGNLDPYTEAGGDNISSPEEAFDVQEAVTFSGKVLGQSYGSDFALIMDDKQTESIFSPLGEGLINYPEFGGDFEWRQRATSTDPRRSGVTWADTYRSGGGLPENGFLIDHDAGSFRVFEFDSASGTQIINEPATFPADEWVRMKVETNDTNDQLTYSAFDESGSELMSDTVTISINTDDLRGIGWRNAGNKQTVYWDAAVIID